jgi:hypothetical protein
MKFQNSKTTVMQIPRWAGPFQRLSITEMICLGCDRNGPNAGKKATNDNGPVLSDPLDAQEARWMI